MSTRRKNAQELRCNKRRKGLWDDPYSRKRIILKWSSKRHLEVEIKHVILYFFNPLHKQFKCFISYVFARKIGNNAIQDLIERIAAVFVFESKLQQFVCKIHRIYQHKKLDGVYG